MALARKDQIDIEATPYYHCISRCVRQAFLCGRSKQTGKNFEHRRAWVLSRLKELAEIFSINICAYAIMANHYHLILHVDTHTAKTFSKDEVIARWKRLIKSAPDVKILPAEIAEKLVAQWREQLMDISWFMRCLNEYLARRANLEDGCKGRFWEGRYKSQALLDEGALLTCMAYVDLNPVRAKISTSLEDSDFTSIQQRLRSHAKQDSLQPKLMPLCNPSQQAPISIPFDEASYFELVHWTGITIREDKKGFIPVSIKNNLNNYGVNDKQWIYSVQNYGRHFSWLVGQMDAIKERCMALKKKWSRSMAASNLCFLNRVA